MTDESCNSRAHAEAVARGVVESVSEHETVHPYLAERLIAAMVAAYGGPAPSADHDQLAREVILAAERDGDFYGSLERHIATAIRKAEERGARLMRESVDGDCGDCEGYVERGLTCPECPRRAGASVGDVTKVGT